MGRRQVEPAFLPTLFDRLQDDEPTKPHESPDTYAPGRERMREMIRRDLQLLLGTVNQEEWMDRMRYPYVASSATNYGLPPLSGSWALTRKWVEVEAMIRRAMVDFEPRLSPQTLQVQPLMAAGVRDVASVHSLLRFEISGVVQLTTYPLAFRVQTAVDLESRRITLEN